jgi:NitT/TauT family transport system ATP-binding protein
LVEGVVISKSSGDKIRVQHLGIVFERDGKRVSVLEDINFNIADGEFICIVGPSGCGKSTLLNVLAGFLAPTSGSVTIDGEPVSGPDPRRILVFQETGVFPWLTVEENIGFGLSKLPRAERNQRIAHYVQMVRLQGFERSYPSDLSGGMKQRLQVARALAVNPDTLYLDEPFGALDSITRVLMRGELLRIWQTERRTILFVTHDIDEAVQLADRVIVLSFRPAKVEDILSIDLPHPRNISSPRYLQLRDDLLKQIGLAYTVWIRWHNLVREGKQHKQISEGLKVSPRMAALWRGRFLLLGVEGLLKDAPRPGPTPSIPASDQDLQGKPWFEVCRHKVTQRISPEREYDKKPRYRGYPVAGRIEQKDTEEKDTRPQEDQHRREHPGANRKQLHTYVSDIIPIFLKCRVTGWAQLI